jgi:cellulose synthase/poly-beta-1,6-N-acetylglucosamine synthase-like glycosyltransferase
MLLLILGAVVAFVYWLFQTKREVVISTLYQDYKQIEKPDLQDEGSVDLSIVVPMFNEQDRLGKMYSEALGYLKNKKITHEFILVDDGSTDGTFRVASDLQERVLKLHKNMGKGGAVRSVLLINKGNGDCSRAVCFVCGRGWSNDLCRN